MNLAELNKIATAMVAPGRGILAADESSGTIQKRFDQIGVTSSADSRRDYRELLAVAPDKVRFVYLKGSPALIAERLRTRQGHFFDPNLLRSQFDALEEPQGVIEVDIAADPEAIVDSMLAALQLCERDP